MPPPPAARAKLLDAFVTILLEQGERAATLDAVAAAAGVSKGGLLYHFPSKDALVEALCVRVEELAAADARQMREAPEGPVEYYIRTSVYADPPIDRTIVAVTRLSQDADTRAREALAHIHRTWLDVLVDTIDDPVTARAVMLIGDGLYFNAALSGTPDSTPRDVDDLLTVVQRMIDG